MRRELCTVLLGVSTSVVGQSKGPVTFAEHIAPLVFEHCAACHRPDQAAPFALLTYKDVYKRAKMIERVVRKRYMPPWHPAPGHGEFAGERRLTDAEVALFTRWIEYGKPLGDPAKLPKRPTFPSEWQLGPPDLVLEMREEFPVPAAGPDVWRSFVLPLDLPKDRWVKAVELRPRARSALHHALFFLVPKVAARKLKSNDGKPGVPGMRYPLAGSLGGFVPGTIPEPMAGDLAMHVPAHTDLVVQTHFHATGKAHRERVRVGLYFAKQPPKRQFVGLQLPPMYGRGKPIDIAPGDKAYVLEDRMTIPVEVTAHSVGGHAHYICKSMRLTARLPGGGVERLLYIADWDYDWQTRYRFKQPVVLPAGTILEARIVYDNSASNPENPFSPPRRIGWGEDATAEMGVVDLRVTTKTAADEKALQRAVHQKTGGAIRRYLGGPAFLAKGFDLVAWLAGLDANKDGKLSPAEVPKEYRERMFSFDRDLDGELDVFDLSVIVAFRYEAK